MRRSVGAIWAALGLAGCIPQVEPPAASASPASPEPVQRERPPARPAPNRGYEPSPRQPIISPLNQGPAPEVSALPAPRPAWEAHPIEPDAREIPTSTYLVDAGETLTRVANETGASAEAIARANALDAPFSLRAGQRLTIPGGRYHLVRPGQTGIGIARAYGVEWSRIVAANGLEEPYALRVGQRVLVPGAAPTQGISLADRAAAFTLDIDDLITGSEPALAKNEAPVKAVASPKRVLPTTAAIAAPTRFAGTFAWPVEGRVVKRFGPGASGERNDGIKIAVPLQTPIHAAADGVVAYVGSGIAALGGLVIIRHGERWVSVYGHAAKLLVQRGQAVKRGQTIALSGDTGFADRPEVHFELRKGRTPVDPTTQLPPV